MIDWIPVNVVLENGVNFEGRGWGDFSHPLQGEFVFSTAMSGIEESLTDPSYAEQVIVSTVAHVGNTGISLEDMESARVWATGLICRHLEVTPSNWRSKMSLAKWMASHSRFIVDGVNTRALTLMLRDQGSQRGVVYAKNKMTKDQALNYIKNSVPPMQSRELVSAVSTTTPYVFESDVAKTYWPIREVLEARGLLLRKAARIGVWDFGLKKNMLRILDAMGFVITVLPSSSKAEEVLKCSSEGLFLTNGPGDPSACDGIVEELKSVIGKLPIMGICMGHQLLCRALGAKTYKLKFGHRGIHHPVVELDEKDVVRRTWITSQNHGFAVDATTLPKDVRVSFRHADDGTVEGIESAQRQLFSVQFHPEVGPGPVDALDLFGRFKDMVENARR